MYGVCDAVNLGQCCVASVVSRQAAAAGQERECGQESRLPLLTHEDRQEPLEHSHRLELPEVSVVPPDFK